MKRNDFLATKIIFVGLVLSLVTACASQRSKDDRGELSAPAQTQNGEEFGPPLPIGPEPLPENQSTGQISKNSRLISLVFSPAQVRGLASIGVLRALKEKKIEIKTIYAAGWPSVFACLYAKKMRLGELEWAVERLKRVSDPTRWPDHLIEQLFRNQKIEDLRIPVVIVKEDGAFIQRGSIYEALKETLQTTQWSQNALSVIQNMESSNTSQTLFVNWTNAKLKNPVNSHVLTIKSDRFPDSDLTQASELIYLGKQALFQYLDKNELIKGDSL